MNERSVVLAVALAGLLAAAGCASAPTDDAPLSGADAPADPESDRIGWEQGYWHNESLPVTPSDGLNETEQAAVVHRAMARVEYIRGVEFDRNVPVQVVSREAFRNQSGGGGGGPPAARRTFENVRSEALFLVGEGGDSVQQQESNTEASVVGYYSPGADRIVVISETETPVIDEGTLVHELVHAIQFRHFDMGFGGTTLEARSASLGLVEGDAEFVTQQYTARCGDEWQCLTPEPTNGGSGAGGSGDGGSAGGGLHYGLYFTQYFPYSDGPGFVEHFYEQGGWDAVNALYEDPPASAEQVALPEKYGTDPPVEVSLADRSDGDWERVRPPNRAPYSEVGVAGLTGMFAYPAYETSMNPTADPDYVVPQREFLNFEGDSVDTSDPINYTTTPVKGWDGDRLHVYRNGDRAGYVWKLVWDSPRDAEEFASTYTHLLRYWGARHVGDGLYRIPEDASSFADAFHVSVSGDTVVVVNAPTRGQLDDVRGGTPTS